MKRLRSVDGKDSQFEAEAISIVLEKLQSDRFKFDGRTVYTADRSTLVYVLQSYTNLLIPEGVRTIGRRAAARQVNLTKLFLAPTVEKIGKEAFAGCVKLESVTLPASVKSVCGLAFAYCEKLKEVTFESVPKFLAHKAFFDCKSLQIIRVPEGSAESFRKSLRVADDEDVQIIEQTSTMPEQKNESVAEKEAGQGGSE